MSNLEQFKIDLLNIGDSHQVFNYDIDDSYFEAIDAPAVRKGQLRAQVEIDSTEGVFEVRFHIEGLIMVPCDLCLEDMEQEVSADSQLLVKLGDGYSDDEDMVIIDEREGILDLAWFIYEFIELNIPLRHVHAPGKCNPAMMKILEEHSAARSGEGDEDKPVDSRWEALLKLKE